MVNIKKLVTSLAIPLAAGGGIALITKNSINLYAHIIKPVLAPPSLVFPIAWTVLYILMGISLYLIGISENKEKRCCEKLFAFQLFINALWPIMFFNMCEFELSAFLLCLLIVSVLFLIVLFYRVNPLSAFLQIPYLLWCIFAEYLNVSIALLNR